MSNDKQDASAATATKESSSSPSSLTTVTSVEEFVNDSALMIAYERSLETSRDDALFQDPLAATLAGGTKGKTLSDAFGAGCTVFGLPGWPEFHKMWTAVRTKFIDDTISQHFETNSSPATSRNQQLVNLGAGMDTRAYRLECFKSIETSFEVDMPVINEAKEKVFSQFLFDAQPLCPHIETISIDFMDETSQLDQALQSKGFDKTSPCCIIAEGLIMYLGDLKERFLQQVSSIAAPGSTLVLNFLEVETAVSNNDNDDKTPSPMAAASISTSKISTVLTQSGWTNLKFYAFGDEGLNFGRFDTQKYTPCKALSFVVCTKGTNWRQHVNT